MIPLTTSYPMTEPFSKTEPETSHAKRFVELVNQRNAIDLDALLKSDRDLCVAIDTHWFGFDSPAIVTAKDSEAVIKVLLRHGANINERSSWWAGSFGVLDGASPEMAQFLIERGAKLDIHSAAELGRSELVQDFLDAEPTLVNARGGDGQTPLHVAATIEIVNILLDQGADHSVRCLDHSATPVQYAVSNPETCRHLILRGATPDAFLACAIGDREMLEQILQDEPEAIVSRVGSCPHTSPVDERSHLHIYFWKLLGASTPLDVAREFDHRQLYRELFEKSPPVQQFLAASREGDREKVQQIVSHTPDDFARLDPKQQTEMARAAWEGRLESVRVMLDFGFDPHLPGDENSTPLDRAAFHGHREIVELLLDVDPQPPLEFKNNFGSVPLACCAYGASHSWKQNTDHLGTAKALIAAGAKVDPSWLPIQNEAIDQLFQSQLS